MKIGGLKITFARSKQALSVILTACLIWSSGNLAEAARAAAPSLPRSSEVEFAPPSSLGFITDSFNTAEDKGTKGLRDKGNPLVILIQDLHAHYGVQKNIAGILDFLTSQLSSRGPRPPVMSKEGGRGDLSFSDDTDRLLRYARNDSQNLPFALAVEGASGPIDSSVMALFPDQKIKQAAADFLMREGELTGAEYFAVMRGLPQALTGVEDIHYYDLHRDLFRKTLKDREQMVGSLKGIQADLASLRRQVYSKELKHFQHKLDRFERGDISQGDMADWLASKAQAFGIAFNGRSAEDIQSIAYLLKTQMAQSQAERDLVQVEHDLALLLSVADLQATEPEVRSFGPRLNQFVAMCHSLFASNGLRAFDEQKVRELISTSIDYYAIALMRNKPMVDNTLSLIGARLGDEAIKRLRNGQSPNHLIIQSLNTAVLVAGGFHTRPIIQLLRERHISYVVITPNVGDLKPSDQELYVKRLSGQLLTDEEILASAPVKKSPLSWWERAGFAGGEGGEGKTLAVGLFSGIAIAGGVLGYHFLSEALVQYASVHHQSVMVALASFVQTDLSSLAHIHGVPEWITHIRALIGGGVGTGVAAGSGASIAGAILIPLSRAEPAGRPEMNKPKRPGVQRLKNWLIALPVLGALILNALQSRAQDAAPKEPHSPTSTSEPIGSPKKQKETPRVNEEVTGNPTEYVTRKAVGNKQQEAEEEQSVVLWDNLSLIKEGPTYHLRTASAGLTEKKEVKHISLSKFDKLRITIPKVLARAPGTVSLSFDSSQATNSVRFRVPKDGVLDVDLEYFLGEEAGHETRREDLNQVVGLSADITLSTPLDKTAEQEMGKAKIEGVVNATVVMPPGLAEAIQGMRSQVQGRAERINQAVKNGGGPALFENALGDIRHYWQGDGLSTNTPRDEATTAQYQKSDDGLTTIGDLIHQDSSYYSKTLAVILNQSEIPAVRYRLLWQLNVSGRDSDRRGEIDPRFNESAKTAFVQLAHELRARGLSGDGGDNDALKSDDKIRAHPYWAGYAIEHIWVMNGWPSLGQGLPIVSPEAEQYPAGQPRGKGPLRPGGAGSINAFGIFGTLVAMVLAVWGGWMLAALHGVYTLGSLALPVGLIALGIVIPILVFWFMDRDKKGDRKNAVLASPASPPDSSVAPPSKEGLIFLLTWLWELTPITVKELRDALENPGPKQQVRIPFSIPTAHLSAVTFKITSSDPVEVLDSILYQIEQMGFSQGYEGYQVMQVRTMRYLLSKWRTQETKPATGRPGAIPPEGGDVSADQLKKWVEEVNAGVRPLAFLVDYIGRTGLEERQVHIIRDGLKPDYRNEFEGIILRGQMRNHKLWGVIWSGTENLPQLTHDDINALYQRYGERPLLLIINYLGWHLGGNVLKGLLLKRSPDSLVQLESNYKNVVLDAARTYYEWAAKNHGKEIPSIREWLELARKIEASSIENLVTQNSAGPAAGQQPSEKPTTNQQANVDPAIEKVSSRIAELWRSVERPEAIRAIIGRYLNELKMRPDRSKSVVPSTLEGKYIEQLSNITPLRGGSIDSLVAARMLQWATEGYDKEMARQPGRENKSRDLKANDSDNERFTGNILRLRWGKVIKYMNSRRLARRAGTAGHLDPSLASRVRTWAPIIARHPELAPYFSDRFLDNVEDNVQVLPLSRTPEFVQKQVGWNQLGIAAQPILDDNGKVLKMALYVDERLDFDGQFDVAIHEFLHVPMGQKLLHEREGTALRRLQKWMAPESYGEWRVVQAEELIHRAARDHWLKTAQSTAEEMAAAKAPPRLREFSDRLIAFLMARYSSPHRVAKEKSAVSQLNYYRQYFLGAA